jgi:hypothetical protein
LSLSDLQVKPGNITEVFRHSLIPNIALMKRRGSIALLSLERLAFYLMKSGVAKFFPHLNLEIGQVLN